MRAVERSIWSQTGFEAERATQPLTFLARCRHLLHLASSSSSVAPARYSYASDVWSFGVTLFEMAMLVPPFKGANVCQAIPALRGEILRVLIMKAPPNQETQYENLRAR